LTDEYEEFQDKCEYSTQFLNKLNVFSEEQNKKINIKLIKISIIFAKKSHAGQMRKIGNIPYYSHPLEVALNVAKYYLKTDVIIAAVLHDVVEDSDATVEMIEKEFNPRIAQMVDRLTKIRYVDGKKIKLALRETIEELYAIDDYEALFIKSFDRLHNLETIEGLSDKKKQTKMAQETTNFLVGMIALVAEKLGVHKKISIENKVFNVAYNVLSGKK
jgi:(p)ppGpp synthase/HD superfamily hydrolase